MLVMKLMTIVAVGAVLVSISACDKDYKNCLVRADTYEKNRIDCLAKTDAKERAQCVDQNEVTRITRQDCNEAFH
jgi:hypothetical protein